MNLRTFIMGLIFVPIGIFLMLFFSVIDNFQMSNVFKWLGVALMIGGPLLFWEIIPVWNEKE